MTPERIKIVLVVAFVSAIAFLVSLHYARKF